MTQDERKENMEDENISQEEPEEVEADFDSEIEDESDFVEDAVDDNDEYESDDEENEELDEEDAEGDVSRQKKKSRSQQRQKKKRVGSQKKPDAGKKTNKKPTYIQEVTEEMRRTTWPSKKDVAKWGAIVIAALAFFTVFTLVADNFIVTPVMYFVSGITETTEFGPLAIILTIVMFLSGILLLITIMMHSGADGGGLSDTAATSIAGGANSTAIVERNLDRITIILAIIFVLSIIGMMLFFPQGMISQG